MLNEKYLAMTAQFDYYLIDIFYLSFLICCLNYGQA